MTTRKENMPARQPCAARDNHWIADQAMTLLVDYYPEVPTTVYGAGATAENVVPFLRELKPGYLCIYAKGHSGYTTWRSSLHTEHIQLSRDMPAAFRRYTRETGTPLVFYYSGLLDGIAGERHPEWLQWDLDGKPRGNWFSDFKNLMANSMCPLSRYWDDWVKVHMRELIGQYDPEGIWVDGDWPGPCYCPRCRERYRADTGHTAPWSELVTRPEFAAEYARTWNRITHEWRTKFNAYVKELKPACVYSAGNVSPRREFLEPFDWRSGDFFSPGFHNLRDMARMMRCYTTLGVPYDAYVCDTSFTHVRKNVRSRSKTLDRMMQEAVTVAANGGVVGYWTYPLGNGAWVPSRMKKAIAVRRYLTQCEDIFLHTESAAWAAVLASDPASPALGDAGTAGGHNLLAATHASPDVMDESGVTGKMPYRLILLPEQACLDAGTAGKLEAFVRAGGVLISSGQSVRSAGLQKMLGVRAVEYGKLNDGHVILRTGGEPTGIDSAWDCIESDAETLYPLYLTWDAFNFENRNMPNNWPMFGQMDEEHPAPAGFPAAITRTLGKGRVVHIATNLCGRYFALGDPQMLRWFREILAFALPDAPLRTDAPSWVDISLRRKDGALLVHIVNQNPGRDISRLHTDDTWVDEIPEVGPYQLALRTSRQPDRAVWQPGGIPADCSWNDGVLQVTIPPVRFHTCLRIEGGV